LESFTETAGIDDVTVVYAPYIYNVVPQLTRFRGYHGEHAETFFAEQARLQQRVRQAGFRYLDIGDVALQEIARRKTQFAAFSLFIDHVHLSPYGIDQVAEALTDN
jgi:lysophospholipase L1-like esterase